MHHVPEDPSRVRLTRLIQQRQRAKRASPRSIMVQEEEGLDTKKDRSLVTTADYATQALISWYAFMQRAR